MVRHEVRTLKIEMRRGKIVSLSATWTRRPVLLLVERNGLVV
ncbi:MAG: hypothetical protein VYC32_06445 [Planctomycetota bacterium]|nr:hypothetical protein [Planctomycetota bacterium]MEE3297948.1 hypothetical protein [Planctomycetota bacterium]